MLDGLWRLLLNRESLFGIHGHDKLYTRIDGWCDSVRVWCHHGNGYR